MSAHRDVVVAEDGEAAGDGSDDECGVRLHQHVRHSADRHTASQGRVQSVQPGSLKSDLGTVSIGQCDTI